MIGAMVTPMVTAMVEPMLGSVSWTPDQLFLASERGAWYDPQDINTLYQDSAGTTRVTGVGQPVGLMLDKGRYARHLSQPTAAKRPTLEARVNMIDVASDAPATQSVTSYATAYTLSFTGTGSIALSGTHVATLNGTGVSDRVSLTFTPTAGTLTLTVSGTVTFAQLELGSAFTKYQQVVTATNYVDIGAPRYLRFDGVDDFLTVASMDMSSVNEVSVFSGIRKNIDGATTGMVCELSASIGSNNGAFALNAPTGSLTDFRFTAKGTTQVAPSAGGNPSPRSAVVTGNAKISTPVTTTRVNGVATSLSTSLGTGNFGSYQFWVGARNGSGSFFNGRIYQLAIRGGATTAADVLLMEAYINSLMGGVY